MPVIRIDFNFHTDTYQKNELQMQLASVLSEILKRDKADIMVIINHSDIVLDGSYNPSAFIEIMCLSDLQIQIKGLLCNRFLEALKSLFAISSDRIYINFRRIEAQDCWSFADDRAICPLSDVNYRQPPMPIKIQEHNNE